MEKIIELTPLAEIGKGHAKITDNRVEVETSGIIGGMKVWLVGGEEAEKVGNIVNGKLCRDIDTTRHTGILITQSGRQMMVGKYVDEEIIPPVENIKGVDEFIELEGIKLKKITQNSYADFCDELRYILSNKNVYRNYKKHGYYCIEENMEYGALALRCEEHEENPLAFFGDMCICKDGYVMVCVDKKTKKIRKF